MFAPTLSVYQYRAVSRLLAASHFAVVIASLDLKLEGDENTPISEPE
jgi:hypothetical protein